MRRYYVQPRDGEWIVRLEEDEIGSHQSRAEAIEAARSHRGDKVRRLFYEDGKPAGAVIDYRGPEALWLLREDGSVYGEIDAELREGGKPLYKNITPAAESSEAVN